MLDILWNNREVFDLNEIEGRLYSDDPIDNLQIKKAKCNKFVLNPKSEQNCMCGRLINEHDNDVIDRYNVNNNETSWSMETCTIEDDNTDAYGTMRFIDGGHTEAEYIRVHYKTPMDKIIRLLFNYWKLKEPKLIISVTGGAQRFSLKPKLKDVFRKGLVKAAVSTGAWISTGGHYTGVMKHVGEAIREYASTLNPTEKIVVLGIANWTMVSNNETLIKTNGERISENSVDYSFNITKKDEKIKKQPLDPNHTHFILVDNAQLKYGGEIVFRGELESAIANKSFIQIKNNTVTTDGNETTVKNEEKIPIVVLVLEGGVGTIETVVASIKNHSPCVFVEGSGKCADLFAYALKMSLKIDMKNRENLQNFEIDIKSRIKKEWGNKDIDKIYENIKFALNSPHLLSVYCLDSNEQAYDIDIAILTSLLRAQNENSKSQTENSKSQLQLALTWNRVDIARDFIFKKEDLEWKPGDLNDIMYNAILANRVEFVKLLLDNGFNIRSFLTNRCLLKLYNDSLASEQKTKSPLYTQLMRNKHNNMKYFNFKDIGEVIQKFVNDIYEPHFLQEPYCNFNLMLAELHDDSRRNEKFDEIYKTTTNPENDLFMFCVLQMQPEMAKVFLHGGYYEISSSLVGSMIYKSYEKLTDGDEENLIRQAMIFEELAVGILGKCYEKSEEKAYCLLIRELSIYGNSTPLQLAIACDAKKLVAHSCTQTLLTTLWYGKIIPDTSKLSIVISLFMPFAVPLLISFKEDKENHVVAEKLVSKNKVNPSASQSIKYSVEESMHFHESGMKLSYHQKIYQFYRAPFVKYICSQVFYMLFLVLFSYVMLCDFFPLKTPNQYRQSSLGLSISIPEIILIIWVFSHSLDEFRQFFQTDSNSFKYKWRSYFYNIWNIVEIASILIYIIALILRLIPDNRSCYLAARILLSIDLVVWYMRCLNFYSIIRNLGPKLVMIKRLMYELVYYIFIVIVFMFAFGVSTQSLMYHNQKLNFDLLKNVFFPSYFVIGGEYYTLDGMIGVDKCEQPTETDINRDIYTQDDCPEKNGTEVALAIYVAYLTMLNILLVNLLIAIFTYAFEKLQDDTDNIWKFQRYSIIYSYYHKPLLPAPFNIFSYTVYALRFLLNLIETKCCLVQTKQTSKNFVVKTYKFLTKKRKIGFRIRLGKNDDQQLQKWESYIAEDYMYHMDSNSKDKQNPKIQEALDKIESLGKRFEMIAEMRSEMNEKILQTNSKIEAFIDFMKKQHVEHGQAVGQGQAKRELDDKPAETEIKQIESKQFTARPNSQASNKGPISRIQNSMMESKSSFIDIVIDNELGNSLNESKNKKSRSSFYPKTDLRRFHVPNNKMSWSIDWPEYNPVQYTSKAVLLNTYADIDLIGYPVESRPTIDFNMKDKRYKIDRKSCLGVYDVMNGLPQNPMGRTGVIGRGLLNFWGPNHAIEAIFTRWKYRNNVDSRTENSDRKLQFLIVNKNIDTNKWHLPHYLLDFTNSLDSNAIKGFILELFNTSMALKEDNFTKFLNFFNNGKPITKYYKDSHRNTDNAWIEVCVINFHDENGNMLWKVPLREDNEDDEIIAWKDFDEINENDNVTDHKYLRKLYELHCC